MNSIEPPKIDSNATQHVKGKKSVFCYFCESYVTNFPRHLSRNHKSELEVERIFSLPALSSKRKALLFSLRKKGNYLTSNVEIKPVRKGADYSNYLPCKHCLGFYSAKNLWKHLKQCEQNPNKASGIRGNCQAEAQNFFIRKQQTDANLQASVFPRMRPDKISLVAKTDFLICQFGARYLNIHRDQHFIPVTSRKMRDLAKLLIEIQKVAPGIKDLLGALRPENYETMMFATKTVASFDPETQSFKSPTYARNMGTMLKQCCDIALLATMKKSNRLDHIQSAEIQTDLKTLIQLIEGNWRFDISTLASADLDLKKWNKVSIVPLATDVKKLKDYLVTSANLAAAKLNANLLDKAAYFTLIETIYCRLLLLNRRRPGELQRLYFKTYENCSNQDNHCYEEFHEAISETEKALMKLFKRIVIKGKRGRGVPVLISRDVQLHLDLILKSRIELQKCENTNYCNPYLFGKPSTKEPIIGYKVIQKYSLKCGAANPAALTCTRLRKHLATLTQLFNMSENDMEQLALHMGHTLSVHRSSYRLPDDIYQTAKISKLLILMENGQAGQYRGKCLEDIDLNLDEDLLETCTELEPVIEPLEETLNVIDPISDRLDERVVEKSTSRKVSGVGGKKRTLDPWTDMQKQIATTYFQAHIKKKMPPKKKECEILISKYPKIFENKNWLKIKVFVQNKYRMTK